MPISVAALTSTLLTHFVHNVHAYSIECVATLGPPSDDPFDRIVNKAQSQQAEGGETDAGAGNDELKLTLYRNGKPWHRASCVAYHVLAGYVIASTFISVHV